MVPEACGAGSAELGGAVVADPEPNGAGPLAAFGRSWTTTTTAPITSATIAPATRNSRLLEPPVTVS